MEINNVQERVMSARKNGGSALILIILGVLASIALFVFTVTNDRFSAPIVVLLVMLSVVIFITSLICTAGLKVLNPQEALVLTLFGNYSGTLKGEGFYFVHPFSSAVNPAAETELGQSKDVSSKKTKISLDGEGHTTTNMMPSSKKISLKAMTLNNAKQKVNDFLGNPVEIGVAVIWKVTDTAKAVFNVDNFKEYLSLQVDSAVRNIARQYPYDVNNNVEIDTTGDGLPDDGSLRGSSAVVARRIKEEIQGKVEFAGLEIVEARITHLSYASEIAAAMLQRQQAAALIDAKAMIVEGAVGMVEMALEKLEGKGIVDLDDERKAAMVSNLLVVLVGDKDVSPVVNSGSLYWWQIIEKNKFL